MTQPEGRELQGCLLRPGPYHLHLQHAVFLAGWLPPQERTGGTGRTHKLRGGDLSRPWFPNFNWTKGPGGPLAPPGLGSGTPGLIHGQGAAVVWTAPRGCENCMGLSQVLWSRDTSTDCFSERLAQQCPLPSALLIFLPPPFVPERCPSASHPLPPCSLRPTRKRATVSGRSALLCTI